MTCAFGVGGGGFVGIALEQLTPPVQSALATATTGGTITAGTYKYVVTAINASGETTASNEQTIVTTGSTSTVTVTWAAVTGATGYRLYKTAAGGGTGTELLYKTVGVVTSDVDTAPGAPSGAFPTTNTAVSPNTYTAPNKFFPIITDSLQRPQATSWRRTLRQNVDVFGAVPGDAHVEGDIEMECLTDAAVYFHRIGRVTMVKSGTVGPWTYTCTPNASACAGKTASITVVRNGQVFAYVGCVLSSFSYTTEDGMLKAKYSIIGSDEATQTLPVPTFAGQERPFGAGEYSIQIPTATQVFDVDKIEWTVNDNGEPQYRLKSTRGAQFIKYGQREVNLKLERDFGTKADYDAYKALTAQAITIDATLGISNEKFTVTLDSAIKDTYEVGLSGQGDLIRASISYMCAFDAVNQRSYRLVLIADEDIGL